MVALMLSLIIHTNTSEALDGNQWRKLSPDMQHFYVSGVLDAYMQFSVTITADKQITGQQSRTIPEMSFDRPGRCAIERKMPYTQMTAIVRQYVEQHPAQWDWLMVGLIQNAFAKACGY
jgi:hypothetical protein